MPIKSTTLIGISLPPGDHQTRQRPRVTVRGGVIQTTDREHDQCPSENTSTSGDAGDEQAAYRHVAGDAAESIGAARTGATEAAAATEALRQVMQERADVFDASPTLAHVRSFADARRAGHWATLLGVLQRTTLAVPPYVVLPPIIGGEVSLNLLTALVGVSSGGKGAADKTAAAAIRFTREGARMPTPSVVRSGPARGSTGRSRPRGRPRLAVARL